MLKLMVKKIFKLLHWKFLFIKTCDKVTALYILQDMSNYAYKAPNEYMDPSHGVIKQ